MHFKFQVKSRGVARVSGGGSKLVPTKTFGLKSSHYVCTRKRLTAVERISGIESPIPSCWDKITVKNLGTDGAFLVREGGGGVPKPSPCYAPGPSSSKSEKYQSRIKFVTHVPVSFLLYPASGWKVGISKFVLLVNLKNILLAS